MSQDKPKHGGKRPGAGRKPRGYVKPSALSDLTRVAALAEPPPIEIDGVAQQHARSALEALITILFHGKSEAAKISAAKEILDRGCGKPAVEIGGDGAPMLPFMMAPADPIRTLGREIREEARRYAHLAVKALAAIAGNGASESARASAARALLERGFGTVAKASMPDELRERPLGKKEAQAAAAAASGVWATPSPPPKSFQ